MIFSGDCHCEISEDGVLICDYETINNFPEDVTNLCPTLELDDVKAIHLRYQNFNVLNSNAFVMFPNLIVVSMTRCNIEKILFDTFKKHEKITRLYLNENNISIIEDGVFDDLVSLEQLDLDFNPIKRYLLKYFRDELWTCRKKKCITLALCIR